LSIRLSVNIVKNLTVNFIITSLSYFSPLVIALL
jgi:hypothetical protein